MKVAISSMGEGWAAKADARFGRAPYFVFVEEQESGVPRITVLKNDAAKAATGVGTEAAKEVIREGAKVVVSGSVGPNAFQVFEQMGIDVYLIQGELTVKDAYERYRDGRLQKMIIKRL